MAARIQLDRERLAEICKRYHVRRLSLFGSILHDDFRPDSDVDMLIEFDPARRPGLVGFYEIEEELSRLFGGHKIDLINPKYLNHRLRDRILSEAEVQFAEG
jgi:predicted nucleotidyltransferase